MNDNRANLSEFLPVGVALSILRLAVEILKKYDYYDLFHM